MEENNAGPEAREPEPSPPKTRFGPTGPRRSRVSRRRPYSRIRLRPVLLGTLFGLLVFLLSLAYIYVSVSCACPVEPLPEVVFGGESNASHGSVLAASFELTVPDAPLKTSMYAMKLLTPTAALVPVSPSACPQAPAQGPSGCPPLLKDGTRS